MSCLLYQSVLDNEEELKEAVEISANAGQSVLEYANVYDGDNKCLIAMVGEIGDKIVQIFVYFRGGISGNRRAVCESAAKNHIRQGI